MPAGLGWTQDLHTASTTLLARAWVLCVLPVPLAELKMPFVACLQGEHVAELFSGLPRVIARG